MISAIACIDEKWGIGNKGELLFHIPDDQRFFKHMTENSTVIMGRKTWESLPIRPLPKRNNIVISNQVNGKYDGAIFMSLEEIKNILNNVNEDDDYFVIGGGQIYKELLPYCDNVFLTHVHKTVEADTYFPQLDNEWTPNELSQYRFYNTLSYQFIEWVRDYGKI